MPISPIGAINVPSAAALSPTSSTAATRTADAVGAGREATGSRPAEAFTDSLQAASNAQGQADGLTAKAATGELTDLTAVMSAMTEAQLSTQLTVALRNKAVESFNEIMRMQI
jgi:flagellar hook-basal body complex protein FliE